MKQLLDLVPVLKRIKMSVFGTDFRLHAARDKKYGQRVYLQVTFDAPCTKTGKVQNWPGRKWYLSDHMTDDEIVKTAYLAFQQAVTHELLEGFKVDGKPLFNPHTSFEALLTLPDAEVHRS